MVPQMLVNVEVSDRAEMEGVSGLHAKLSFKKADKSGTLELIGTATLTANQEIGEIEITLDDIGLDQPIAVHLLRAAFEAGWNAVVISHMAMAGMSWRPLRPWLREHLGIEVWSQVADRVTAVIDNTSRSKR